MDQRDPTQLVITVTKVIVINIVEILETTAPRHEIFFHSFVEISVDNYGKRVIRLLIMIAGTFFPLVDPITGFYGG